MPHAAYPHDFPADASSRRVPHQPWTPSVPANGQAEGHREEMPPPIRGISGSSGAQYPHHVDVGYQGIVDFRPQPVANPAYVFPDVGHVQGLPVQGQPGAPVNQFNQGHDSFGYFHQHVAPGPPQAAAFPHPIPTPNQSRAENLRRLAARYLDHQSALVRMVCTEEDVAGGFKTVIILETPDVP